MPQNTAYSFRDDQVDKQGRQTDKQTASVPILFTSYEEHAHQDIEFLWVNYTHFLRKNGM